VVILLFIAALVAARGEFKGLRSLPEGSVLYLVLSGLATGASWLCYYHALKLGPASRVAPVDKLSVLFAIGLALLFLGEKLSLKAAVGCLLVGSGAVLLALP
jgi:transporter family protein